MRYIAIFVLSLIPAVSFAQIVPCDGVGCGACHVVQLGQNILDFLIKISAALAALMFAFAGFKMVTAGGDVGKVTEGKKIFTNVAIGFIILLAAVLIVDTAMKSVVKEQAGASAGFGPWITLQCDGTPPPATDERDGEDDSESEDDDDPTDPVSENVLDHAAAKEKLGEDISIHSTDGCTSAAVSTCTSLDGIREATLQPVIDLKSNCPPCTVIVTGGTEVGHSTRGEFRHDNGYKIDIDDTSSVQSYLESNLTRDGEVSGYPRYVDAHGNQWLDEGDHWDIQVKG